MWVVSLSAWTPYYRAKLKLVALPSINAALAHATGPIQFILHTDVPDDFKDVHFAGDVDIRLFRPDPSALYQSYGNADRLALELAPEDCFIALLTSDILVNLEFFANAEKRFAEGKRCIIGSAARTLADLSDIPVGLKARDLLNWGFDPIRRHPVTSGCIWGTGRNLVAWMTYWEGPHGTVGRAFHMHPFCVVNDRALYFQRETCDLDLIDRFKQDEVYVACDPTEFAFAEISGLEKAIPQMSAPISIGSIVSWASRNTTPMQRFLFTHRIVVQGDGSDNLDQAPCNEILRILG